MYKNNGQNSVQFIGNIWDYLITFNYEIIVETVRNWKNHERFRSLLIKLLSGNGKTWRLCMCQKFV